jgi:membrane-associated phospholipid phosphatase
VRKSRVGSLIAALLLVLLCGWGLGALARSVTQAADLDAVRDLAVGRDSLLTLTAHALSWAGSGYVIVPLALLCCAALSRRRARSAALAVGVSTAGGFLIASLDKLLVGRPRPPVHHLEAVGSSSFPSGHATQSAAFYFAALIALRMSRAPRWVAGGATALITLLLAGIAWSRVYLGVHHPTDVAAGLLLGGGWALVSAAIVRAHARGPGVTSATR